MSNQSQVFMGESKSANDGLLYTKGLSTCVRIAVTGSYRSGSRGEGHDRFVAHITEETTADGSGYVGIQKFIDTIKSAKANKLEIDEIVMVIGNIAMDDDFESDDENCQKHDAEQYEFSNSVYMEIKEHVASNGEIKVAQHGTDDHYTLCIKQNKEIVLKLQPNGNYENFEAWKANQSDTDDEDDEEEDDDE